jgi:proteic killer suppression protein
VIQSIADPETEKILRFQRSRKLPSDIQRIAQRKLLQLDAAEKLQEMAEPRGNRLEQLKGYDPLRYSVRINDQWRITFNWSNGGADNVRIEDYH